MEPKVRWEYIAELIERNNFTRIAEIGLSTGPTSKYLLERCNLSYYLLVDPDPHGDFPYNTKIWKYAHPKFVRILSNEAIHLVKNRSLDMVYIDANHSYETTKEDIEIWLPKIRVGGIICGHDYGSPDWPGVKKAVDEAFPSSSVNLLLENQLYGKDRLYTNVWWRRK